MVAKHYLYIRSDFCRFYKGLVPDPSYVSDIGLLVTRELLSSSVNVDSHCVNIRKQSSTPFPHPDPLPLF